MYSVGQKFEGQYPPEAAEWCNNNGAVIASIDGLFEIQSIPGPSVSDKIKSEISALEAQQTPRRIREAALTEEGKMWLQNLEDQIAEKRSELARLA